MLYAKQLVKIHFLSQKVCSLNRERMGEENKPVTYTLSRQQCGQVQKPAQGCTLDHAVIQELPELCDTSRDQYTQGNQEESRLKD